eukprot:351114-Chlamydomonas_euryale.AAC.5
MLPPSTPVHAGPPAARARRPQPGAGHPHSLAAGQRGVYSRQPRWAAALPGRQAAALLHGEWEPDAGGRGWGGVGCGMSSQ